MIIISQPLRRTDTYNDNKENVFSVNKGIKIKNYGSDKCHIIFLFCKMKLKIFTVEELISWNKVYTITRHTEAVYMLVIIVKANADNQDRIA